MLFNRRFDYSNFLLYDFYLVFKGVCMQVKEKINWWDKPQKIKNWPNDVDYVMFIDENGNSGAINNIFKKKLNGEVITDDEKYFTITGCIFSKKDYSIMRNNITELKEKYWNNGYYYDTKHKDNRYVCLHSREIRMHTGPFNEKLINYESFVNELSNVLSLVNCKIISVSINLEDYIIREEKVSVYEKAFDLLLERCIYATNNKKRGIIMLESRGKKDDKQLLGHIDTIIRNKGTMGIKSNELIKKIIGVYFNPKWYGGHSSTFSGLEIADLFSYPIHQYVKYKKENISFNVIKNKIDCYPNFKNKGIKIFP